MATTKTCARCGALKADHMDYGRAELVCPTIRGGTWKGTKTCPTCRTPLELTQGIIGVPMIPAPFIRNKSTIYIQTHEGRFWACATCEHCEAA